MTTYYKNGILHAFVEGYTHRRVEVNYYQHGHVIEEGTIIKVPVTFVTLDPLLIKQYMKQMRRHEEDCNV